MRDSRKEWGRLGRGVGDSGRGEGVWETQEGGGLTQEGEGGWGSEVRGRFGRGRLRREVQFKKGWACRVDLSGGLVGGRLESRVRLGGGGSKGVDSEGKLSLSFSLYLSLPLSVSLSLSFVFFF